MTGALRELSEETNMDLTNHEITPVDIYDEDWLDPRIHNNVNHAHAIYLDDIPKFQAGDDAAAVKLVPVTQILKGMFSSGSTTGESS